MSAKTKAEKAVTLPPGCESLLSKQQLCFAVGVSLRTFISMVSAGQFPAPDTYVGKLPKWRVATLNEWIGRKCQKPGGG